MKAVVLIVIIALLAAGCADGPIADSATSTSSPTSTMHGVGASTSSSIATTQPSTLPMCDETGHPTAPEDWYADTPLYVGNEMPIEEVQAFASTLAGYENVWIDREHLGWVTVGFFDADVVAHQAALEAEFPGVGVVAVDMPYSARQLGEISRRIHAELPEGMDARSVNETRGVVEVAVGLLTPERIAVVEAAVGDDPVCLMGKDPATAPLPGPQPDGGDGWAYLGEVDANLETEILLITNREGLADVWLEMDLGAQVPEVDLLNQIAIALTTWHSGSCPETRLDDVIVDDDLVQAVIVSITEEMFCTDGGGPRTYLMSLDRDRLPPAPFRVTTKPRSSIEVTVDADLREPGSVAAEGEVRPTSRDETRTPTSTPFIIETGFPRTFTIDPSCGVDYLGVINWVGWHAADGSVDLPPAWDQATVNRLLDLQLLMTEGPEPTLTATAGEVNVLYLPGADEGPACG